MVREIVKYFFIFLLLTDFWSGSNPANWERGPGIFRLRLRDRRVEKVVSLRREPPILSSWLGLTPDGSVMVSNTVGSSEIYALDWEAP